MYTVIDVAMDEQTCVLVGVREETDVLVSVGDAGLRVAAAFVDRHEGGSESLFDHAWSDGPHLDLVGSHRHLLLRPLFLPLCASDRRHQVHPLPTDAQQLQLEWPQLEVVLRTQRDSVYSRGQCIPQGTVYTAGDSVYSRGQCIQQGTVYTAGDSVYSRGQCIQQGTVYTAGDSVYSRGQRIQQGTVYTAGDRAGDSVYSRGQCIQQGTVYTAGDSVYSRGQCIQQGTVYSRGQCIQQGPVSWMYLDFVT